MLSKQVTLGDISFTANTETGRASIAKGIIYKNFGITESTDEAESLALVHFARAITQCTDVQGVAFKWPTAASSGDELRTALNCWLELPGRVVQAWIDALNEVDKPPGDENLKNE